VKVTEGRNINKNEFSFEILISRLLMKTCILVDNASSMRRPLDGLLTHQDMAKCGAELMGSALTRMGPSNGKIIRYLYFTCYLLTLTCFIRWDIVTFGTRDRKE